MSETTTARALKTLQYTTKYLNHIFQQILFFKERIIYY